MNSASVSGTNNVNIFFSFSFLPHLGDNSLDFNSYFSVYSIYIYIYQICIRVVSHKSPDIIMKINDIRRTAGVARTKLYDRL